MIIVRSPLRISLGGGGTDLPSYYSKHGGFVISAAIDKYVYISLHQTFEQELILKYSQMEKVQKVTEVQHPIIKESLQMVGIEDPSLEITSSADIPAGTGLGSSGSFTTALLKALHVYKNDLVTPQALAEEACLIEIDLLHEPIGKQDQYIASFGGLMCFNFLKGQTRAPDVEVSTLNVSKDTILELEDSLILFFTGYSRSASDVLRDQDSKSKVDDAEMTKNLHFVKELGRETKQALEQGNLARFGEIMNIHWEHKKKRSSKMSNDFINELYQYGLAHGAIGGKLIGAGGGGFVLFCTADKKRLRAAMRQKGLAEVRFHFDFEGTKRIV
jgi:D-glycero-alpha-D-manno-heptose-7-phosphate kinase